MERESGRAPVDHGPYLTRLASYRDAVLPIIDGVIPSGQPQRHLYDLLREHLRRPGKGMRPALCLATTMAFGGRQEEALPTAGALELLHNALLVHDDVEDESEYRRAVPTINKAHGVPLAVNAGDALNALTLRLLMQNRDVLGPVRTWRVLEEFDHLLLESLEGQAMELGWIRDNDCRVSEDDYLLMILKKTCWYSFIHPARLGALIAGENDLDRFNGFGYLTGAAFQIQDDILNLVGQQAQYGKEIGGDLWEGKRTLMLADAFQRVSAAERSRLEEIFSKPRSRRLQREVDWISSLLHATGSIDRAASAARELSAAARQAFETAYASAPESEHKDFVRWLVNYAIERAA
jgi:geranylgeranyl diphosphate synthase type II